MQVHKPPPPSEFIRQNAARKARHLGQTGRIPWAEVDDFAADLAAHVVKKWPQYDARRALPAGYVLMLVAGHSLTLLRKRSRQLRIKPVDDPGPKAGPHDDLPGSSRANAVPGRDDPALHRMELSDDVRSVLGRAPPELRRSAEALARAGSFNEAAAIAGVHRSTLHRHREELRKLFGDLRN